jgi:hypothetical protein
MAQRTRNILGFKLRIYGVFRACRRTRWLCVYSSVIRVRQREIEIYDSIQPCRASQPAGRHRKPGYGVVITMTPPVCQGEFRSVEREPF